MSLDPRFVLAPSLQEYFVDKTTGLPLVDGTVEFFSDVNRNLHKPVYKISGTPPNYNYIELPNPVNLSSVGTVMDASNNDVLPYYYPYDADGNIELYYIVVKDSAGNVQFTREGYPNITDETASDVSEIINYVPNGQFLLHNDNPPPASTVVIDGVSVNVTVVAPGGWTYQKNQSSSATDTITFTRLSAFTTDVAESPRFAIKINRSVPSNDSIADLRIRWMDVNKFASATQLYTFFFSAKSNSLSVLNNVDINLFKFFGTSPVGGSTPSPSVTTTLSTVNIATVYKQFNTEFSFGTNEGKTLGDNDDDYLELCINFPANSTFNVDITDLCLTLGSIDSTINFPVTTNGEFVLEALSNLAPTSNNGANDYYVQDGSNLYLPLVMTPAGFSYDYSQIGKIEAGTYQTAKIGELSCNGGQYLTTGYSTDGIPYSRLQSVLWSESLLCPIYGTGSNYFTTSVQSTGDIILTTNTHGSCTNSSAGTTSFVVTTNHTGGNYNVVGYRVKDLLIYVRANAIGSTSNVSAGTSGFTVSQLRNSASVNALFSVVPVAAAALAGTYFTFSTTAGNYYMWFKVDGSGADPAPGGTGIRVDLLSTWTASDVTNIICDAISGYQQTIIAPSSAASITSGQYFTMTNAAAQQFYVWYKKDGTGTDPAPSGTGIEVDILTADTKSIVVTKTITAINSKYFAVPNLIGMFLRGNDPDGIWDQSAAFRWGSASNGLKNSTGLGTGEFDEFLAHTHNVVSCRLTETPPGNQIQGGVDWQENGAVVTDSTGAAEVRPVNSSVNWYIKY